MCIDFLLGWEAQDRRPAAAGLERVCSAWNMPRFFAEARGRRSNVPPEQAGEMALIREPGLGCNFRDRSAVTSDLRRGPVQPQTAALLADRNPVSGAKDASQVGRLDADGRRELAQPDRVAEPRP